MLSSTTVSSWEVSSTSKTLFWVTPSVTFSSSVATALSVSTVSFSVLLTSTKAGAAANAVDIHVTIADRDYRMRLFEATGALFGKKNAKINPGEEGYDDLYFEDMGQKIAVIKHALKAVGVPDDVVVKVSKTLDPTKIVEGIKALVDLVPAEFQKRPVDVFLEYQWEIADEQDRTYPTLPKNMKGGRFLAPATTPVGSWKEVRNDKGLSYVDDAGNVHIFDRSADFMDSNKGTVQGVGAPTKASDAINASAEKADKSTW